MNNSLPTSSPANLDTLDTTDDMPIRSEAEFVAQAETARVALQQFVVVKDFVNADDAKVTTMVKAIDATVCHLFSLSFAYLIFLLAWI